jgi:acyl carrier protein
MPYAPEIRTFVVTNFLFGDAGSLRDDTSFLGSGIIDSTGILELVEFIESTYGISIETQEMLPANLDSVNQLSRFVSMKLGVKPTGDSTA